MQATANHPTSSPRPRSLDVVHITAQRPRPVRTVAPGLAELVSAAADGDNEAWATIVNAYHGLVSAVARSHRLSPSDVADVTQAVWMRLFEKLKSVRDPERLGAWLAVTARHEALRVVRKAQRLVPMASEDLQPRDVETPAADANILRMERDAELRKAVEVLPPRCQRLLDLLMADPPLTYQEISVAMNMPIGSIGPTRARCLACLRRQGEALVA